MQIIFHLFASAREKCGNNLITVDVPEDSTLETAVKSLQSLHPNIDEEFIKMCKIAHEGKYISLATKVIHEHIYLLIPPVSGG